jgi:hypothetical protein
MQDLQTAHVAIDPLLPAPPHAFIDLASNWNFTVSTKFKYAISVRVSAIALESVSLALSASSVNELLRHIGISISSHAIASDQVQTLSRALQCKYRHSSCCLSEAKLLPTSLKSELPRTLTLFYSFPDTGG